MEKRLAGREIETRRSERRRESPAHGAPLQLTPISRETVNDRVYRELRRALIRGLFDPGQVLTIQELAAKLETSTMPVREALSRLISEQGLEAMPNRSVRVPPVDETRLEHLLKARIVIDGAALDMAAPRLSAADLRELARLAEDHDTSSRGAASAIESQLEINQAFHFRIYEASGSTVMIPIIESLWLQSGPYIRAAAIAFDPRDAVSTSHFHGRIVAALKAGDVARARAALADDIGRAFALLRPDQARKSARVQRRVGAGR